MLFIYLKNIKKNKNKKIKNIKYHVVLGILVTQPGVKPAPPEVEARSLHCWTTEEFPICDILSA